MTIDDAIGFNQALEKDIRAKGMPTFADALKLGIEALKLITTNRLRHRPYSRLLLPGETKD